MRATCSHDSDEHQSAREMEKENKHNRWLPVGITYDTFNIDLDIYKWKIYSTNGKTLSSLSLINTVKYLCFPVYACDSWTIAFVLHMRAYVCGFVYS